jgi:hypothetical protein
MPTRKSVRQRKTVKSTPSKSLATLLGGVAIDPTKIFIPHGSRISIVVDVHGNISINLYEN